MALVKTWESHAPGRNHGVIHVCALFVQSCPYLIHDIILIHGKPPISCVTPSLWEAEGSA